MWKTFDEFVDTVRSVSNHCCCCSHVIALSFAVLSFFFFDKNAIVLVFLLCIDEEKLVAFVTTVLSCSHFALAKSEDLKLSSMKLDFANL